jgi:hypothetical protein
MTTTETGAVTGTKDKYYNLIWYVDACLSNTLRLETYIQDATREGDSELVDLRRRTAARARRWQAATALAASVLSGRRRQRAVPARLRLPARAHPVSPQHAPGPFGERSISRTDRVLAPATLFAAYGCGVPPAPRQLDVSQVQRRIEVGAEQLAVMAGQRPWPG